MDRLETLIDRDEEGARIPDLRQRWRVYAEEIARCLRVHCQSYGLKHFPSQVVDAVQAALRVLVHWLNDTDDARNAFTELCRFGIAPSQKFRSTAGAVQAIQLLA